MIIAIQSCRRLCWLTVFALVALLSAIPMTAQNWSGLKVSGENIVDSSGKNFVMKGLGVGEWTNTEAYMLEWPDGEGKLLWYYGNSRIRNTVEDLVGEDAAQQFWQTWKDNVITEADVARWQSWGVNTVRFSINYHWLSPSDGVYLDSGWQWIDQMVGWCKAHHIYVVLCLHAAPGAQSPEVMSDSEDGKPHLWSEPGIYQPWTIHLWQAIAQRYANEPTVAGYDLLDEPIPDEDHPERGGAEVRAFYVKTTEAIRSADRNHIIFACGTDWCNSAAGMKAILPPWDSNMVLVFHKYKDRNDQSSIKGYLKIRKRYNVPLWNGESGENSDDWARDMVTLLGQHNIGWVWWTYKKVNKSTEPCSIPEPAKYHEILDFVNEKAPKPPEAEARQIMESLAENSATSYCAWNDGLINSLFGFSGH